MKDNILEFSKKVEIINKEYAIYRDEEKGIMFPLNTVNLIARVDYKELSKEEYNKEKFEMKVEDLDYNIIDITRPQSKYFETKKEEDKFTIIDAKVSVRQVWNVSNGLGVYKSFTNKEEAMQVAEELNKEVLNILK